LLLHRLAGGTRTPVLARLNASLVPTFTQDIADDAIYQLWALRNVGDALVLAGAATLAGTTSQVLDRRALTGARVERALLPASGPLFGLAAFANGDLIVGGRAQGPSALQATLSRVNAFGHPSCAAAGACAGKLAADCDDGEACTLDLCDVAKGCVHKPGGC